MRGKKLDEETRVLANGQGHDRIDLTNVNNEIIARVISRGTCASTLETANFR